MTPERHDLDRREETMKTLLAICLCMAAVAGEPEDRARVVIIVGAPGTPEYEAQFRDWAGRWQAAAAKASAEVVRIGLAEEAGGPDRERLRATLAEQAAA